MRLIDADELKSKKEYSKERHEWIVPVAAIDWMHTAEAAPVVHGAWLDLGFSQDEPYGFICSVCNGDVLVWKTCPITGMKFCPNCGAKMDKNSLPANREAGKDVV